MLTGRNCLRNKTATGMRGWASLAPIFALAVLLAWLLSSEEALSYFQSPTSPLPKETAIPTQMPTSTEIERTPSPPPPPDEIAPTRDMLGPTAETFTPTSPTSEAPSVLTATARPTEEQAVPTPASTEAVPTPAMEGSTQATEPMSDELSGKRGAPIWPWGVLGIFSIGAIATGVYLLRREVPGQDGRNQEP